jgi:hypothetical protein
MLENAQKGLAQPFKGLSAAGEIEHGLYKLAPSGVSTASVLQAAKAFLASLTDQERAQVSFSIEAQEWRQWSNVHPFLMRHGLCLDYMTERSREAALSLMEASFSAAGYKEARDVMRLNYTIGEITNRLGEEYNEYGEWLYWVSFFGDPTADGPWGWQIDGHHLIINVLILGDQVVMSPVFMGSEPTHATTGKYAGVSVFDAEDACGLELAQSLDDGQRARAILGDELPDEVFAAAFRDNFDLGYQGLRLDSLSAGQKELASKLIGVYTRRLNDGHAAVWEQAIQKHLDETYFAWMGGTGPDDVFYYRVHSPVVLIEFDHLKGIALENDVATREHIHTIVRTPNGNDYGIDLLRLHYQKAPHHHHHGHDGVKPR